jgi:hypothetical protein
LESKFLSDKYYNLYEKDMNKYNPNRGLYYRLSIPRKIQLPLLRQVLPFMVTRRKQAQTMIDYLENKISVKTCHKILKDLNRKGKEVITVIESIKRNKDINVNTKIEKLADTINVQTMNFNFPQVSPLNIDNGHRSRKQNKRKLEEPTYASLDQFGLN